ncbi:MAG: M3 family peptidase, partial [Parvularculaceae bacterium]
MRRILLLTVGVAALSLAAGCSKKQAKPEESTTASAEDAAAGAAMTSDNLLLAEWSGPYGGVPAFDKMDVSGLKPALEAGMEMNLAEVDAIAKNPEPPTFENTIIALEKSGDALGRAFTYFGIWSNNMSSPEFRVVQEEMAPKIAEFTSKITQNEALFKRVKAVYESEEA